MQRVAAELLATLRKRGDLHLHVFELHSTWTWTQILTVPFLILTLLQLQRLIRRGEIDTVLFSSMVSGLLVLPLKSLLQKHRVRSCIIVHGLDITTPSRPYQAALRSVYRIADAVLPVSGATGDACVQRGLDPGKVHVVHNGIDVNRFRTPGTRSEERERMIRAFNLAAEDVTEDSFIICSVGRQVERKGFTWFIRNVVPHLPEHVQYWLAGEGPETDRIREAVMDSNLSSRVRLLGMLSDPELEALYLGSDLFVMPNVPVENDMEGFGIVMLEAGMFGTPVVAADLEGIKEVITDGENGVRVPTGDARSITEAILRYVNDLEYLREAGVRARTYTKNAFSWDTIAERYVQACTPDEESVQKSYLSSP